MKNAFYRILAILGILLVVGTLKPATSDSSPIVGDFLVIPEIGFSQEMVEADKVGREISVPDDKPAYYQANPNNLLIMGHKQPVFGRLNEIPNYITVYRNSIPTTYHLDRKSIPLAETISSRELYQYEGVILMTCAGEQTATGFSHRLVLYYH